MRPIVPLRTALEDDALLGSLIGGPTFLAWRALLLAARGEPLRPEEAAIFTARTGRAVPPSEPAEEVAFIAGRRSGKTVAGGSIATYLAALCDWSDVLAPGERGSLFFLAQTQRTAKVAFRYAQHLFATRPMLGRLVINETADTIRLSNGIDLEIRPASFRNLRGATAIGVVADELAFWAADEASANPDREILNAVRPALATTGGPLIMVSSPYARRGELWAAYRDQFGEKADPRILVAQGASRDFNPTLPQRVIDRAVQRDPSRAAAEYLGQFRTDVEALLTIEAVEACVGTYREHPPIPGIRYTAFVDPSGGSADSFTLAIGHREGDTAVIDAVRERRPPFSPATVTADFAATLREFRIRAVTGDRYAGEYAREAFRRECIAYRIAGRAKSDLYAALVPAINSERVVLPRHDRLAAQIVGLERRTSRGGRDTIDHGPGHHDDIANGVAGLVFELLARAQHRDMAGGLPPQPHEQIHIREGILI